MLLGAQQADLVAEDNETNQKVIAHQLRILGYTADMAVNGRLALEQWRSGNYALLLTDVHMPEMDGYSLASAIRSEESAGHRTSIIALTANVLRDEDKRCLACGMDGYLSKPVSLQKLRATLDGWLGDGPPADMAGCESQTVQPEMSEAASDVPAEKSIVDLGALIALIGDDPEVIAETLDIFVEAAGHHRGRTRSCQPEQ